MKTRRLILRGKRRLHITIGLIFGLYFLLLGVTGVMINHADDWGLTNRYVSHRYLPGSYRPQDGDATRLDIAVTDLHAGRLFGRYGHWLPDLVTAFWVISILTGVGMLFFRRVLLAPRSRRETSPDEVREPAAADVERR